MKRLFVVCAVLTPFTSNAADFCRVVTFTDWTVTSAKGVHKEDLSEGVSAEIYMKTGGVLFYEPVNPANHNMLMGVTMIGDMLDSYMVTVTDPNNTNTFAFEPHTDSFYEADVFIPDEEQRGKGFDSSAQIIRGKYKACTVKQKLLLYSDYSKHRKDIPY